MPFFRLFILSANYLNEFCVDSKVCMNLSEAYRVGNQFCGCENVYGYVIVEVMGDSWKVISESVYGADYTIYEQNGVVKIKEGRDAIALV